MDKIVYSDEEINNMLKSLDSKIVIPDPPNIDEIINEDKNLKVHSKKHRSLIFRIAGIAAAVCILAVSLKIFSNGNILSQNKFQAKDADSAEILENANEYGIYEGSNEVPMEEESEISEKVYESNVANNSLADSYSDRSVIDDALNAFYYKNSNSTSEDTKMVYSEKQFTININKKRSADITVTKDYSSVVLNDISGENPEMLNAIWSEGYFEECSKFSDGITLKLISYVDVEELENSNYLPYVVDSNGTHYIPIDCIDISDTITEGAFEITIMLYAEDGNYNMTAVLV